MVSTASDGWPRSVASRTCRASFRSAGGTREVISKLGNPGGEANSVAPIYERAFVAGEGRRVEETGEAQGAEDGALTGTPSRATLAALEGLSGRGAAMGGFHETGSRPLRFVARHHARDPWSVVGRRRARR